MKIEADSVLRFSREVTFHAYREDLPALVEFLPNVRAIDVTSRAEEGPIVRLVNIWSGGGDIPAAVRSILSPEMLKWTDYATWDSDRWTCEWTIESHSFKEAVRCSGTNRFIEIDPDRTRLEIRGELQIDMKKVKVVPGFLASTLGRTVEQFMVKQITTNLTTVSGALAKHLERRYGTAG